MGDIFQKVAPGQPMRIQAAAYNRLIDMLRWWLNQSRGGGAGWAGGSRDLVTVRIENSSGHDLEQFDILGISGVEVFPTAAENLEEFCAAPLLAGELPDEDVHEGRFAVVLEPVADGEICRAAIAGIVPVYVDVQDADDWWADVDDGEHETLLSGTSGTAQLLYKSAGGTGIMWCLARLGASSPLPAGDADYQTLNWDNIGGVWVPGPLRLMEIPVA